MHGQQNIVIINCQLLSSNLYLKNEIPNITTLDM